MVIAPPNSDHYKDFKKRRPSPLSLHLEHWTLEELLAARPYINPNVTEREVVKRWVQQGGGQPQGCASYGRQLHEGSEQDGNAAWGHATGHPEACLPQVELDSACLPHVGLDTVALAA